MYSIHKGISLLVCGVLLFASACKKDTSPTTPQADPSNPETLLPTLTVKDGTLKKGTPPAPSTSSSAPKISSSEPNNTVSVAGFTFLLKANVYEGSAKGVYVSVNGTQSYYDVSKTNNRSGRMGLLKQRTHRPMLSSARLQKTTAENEISIGIKIPDHIKPGTFCITYCVYDADGQVSNPITKCVEIKEFGGNSQLAGNWSTTKIVSTDPDVTYLPGVSTCYTDNKGTFCSGTSISYESCTKLTKFDMTFGAQGAFSYIIEADYKYPDFSKICQQLIYETGTTIEDYQGAWHYDSTTQKLYLIIDYTDVDEVDTLEFTLSKLTATELQFGDEDVTYFFKKN